MRRILLIGASIGLLIVVAVIGVRSVPSDAPADRAGSPSTPTDFDPVDAGEPTPDGFRQLLRRDQIQPIYEPEFTDAGSVDWPDDMLVLGVAGASEAKAYPITHLNRHEMVNDVIDGDPILATW